MQYALPFNSPKSTEGPGVFVSQRSHEIKLYTDNRKGGRGLSNSITNQKKNLFICAKKTSHVILGKLLQFSIALWNSWKKCAFVSLCSTYFLPVCHCGALMNQLFKTYSFLAFFAQMRKPCMICTDVGNTSFTLSCVIRASLSPSPSKEPS